MHHSPRISVSVRLRDSGGPWSIKDNKLYHELESARLEFSCYDRIIISTNKVLYEECVAPFLKNQDNQNVTVFAYGQTGSGKTYTMFGTNEEPGIVQRCIHDIFETEKEAGISFMQIYNDKMSDLMENDDCRNLIENNEFISIDEKLSDKSTSPSSKIPVNGRPTPTKTRKDSQQKNQRGGLGHKSPKYASLSEILNDDNFRRSTAPSTAQNQLVGQRGNVGSSKRSNAGVDASLKILPKNESRSNMPLFNLTHESKRFPAQSRNTKEIRVFSTPNNTSASNLYVATAKSPEFALALIEAAQKHRITASTKLNATSSRSHAILQITCQNRCLTLIDLAGSEKAGSDHQRNIEGAYINKSLLSLSRAIGALGRNERPAFRESKLTRILQPSLSGKAAVVAVCAVSPEKECASESLATLRFAAGLSAVRLKERLVERECECKCCLKLRKLQSDLGNMNEQKSTNGSNNTFSPPGKQGLPLSGIQNSLPPCPDDHMPRADPEKLTTRYRDGKYCPDCVPKDQNPADKGISNEAETESDSRRGQGDEIAVSTGLMTVESIPVSHVHGVESTTNDMKSDKRNQKPFYDTSNSQELDSGSNHPDAHTTNRPGNQEKKSMAVDFDEINEKEELIQAYKELQSTNADNDNLRRENSLFLDRIKSLEATVSNLMSQNPSKRINDLYVLEKNMFSLQLEMIRRHK